MAKLSKADEIFLSMFKDVEILRNPITPGPDNRPNIQCKLNGELVPHSVVIRMVKEWQDAIVESLMER